MPKVLLDTDIFSECLKGKDSTVGKHYQAYLHEHLKLTITSCTTYEVLTGVHKNLPHKLSTYEAALANAEEITPTADDYRLAAEIKGKLLQRGQPVGDIDPLIAACAIRRDLLLATGNTNHYQRIVDLGFSLTIRNWREP